MDALTPSPALDEKRRRLLALLMAEEGIDPLRSPILRLPRAGTSAGTRTSGENAFPLSFSQERLWLIDRLEPGSGAYNLPAALRLAGRLDRGLLAQTLSEIVRRHEILRTTYAERPGGPVQVVQPPAPVAIPLIDLGGLALAQRDREARRLATAEAGRPFDLAEGPVLRVQLLRLTPEEHALSFTLHHIASDGWSNGVLVAELSALYGAFARGLPSPLPELPLQYGDFAAWQRGVLQGETLARSLDYWRGILGSPPPPLPLPADRPRPAVPSPEGRSVPFRLGPERLAPLRELARRTGTTLFMLVTAAFATLLTRWTGETDLAVGTPVAGRDRREVEGLIGFFVNTLVLRVDTSGDPAFAELLERIRRVTLGAFAHQDLPFGKLVQELNPERSLGGTPFFQAMCGVLSAAGGGELVLPGLTLLPQEAENRSVLFDLTLSLGDAGSVLGGGLEYRADLFDRTTAERLAVQLGNLLDGAVAAPGRRLSDLPLLSAAEVQALREWNDTAVAHPLERGLGELLAEQAERTPDAVAVELADAGGGSLSYGELAARARAWAGRLRELGVGPESRVGIAFERSPELMVALVAVLTAGAAYVPLDPAYPPARLRFLLEDSGVPLLLTQERLLPVLPELPAGVQISLLDGGVPPPVLPPQGGWPADALAYVLYTSGSTGAPKGAMNTQRAIVNRLLWMQERYALTPQDHVLQKTPISFDVSVWELFWPLLVGARLVLARPGGHQDPAYLARTIALREITTLHFVPSMLQAFLAEPGIERCLSLSRVIASGEALPAPLVERFHSRLPTAGLHNLYGPTEAAVDVTAWACVPGDRRPAIPIGRPIANTAIRLLDRDLAPVSAGVTGELWIGGVQPARGYLGRPDLTAERFLPDPRAESPGARLYRTGDLARYGKAGEIEYLGRTDGQVKVRGVRIELAEIEAALREHPGVLEAAVVLQDDNRLLAWLVPREETAGPVLRRLRLERRGLPEGASLLDLPDGTPVVQRNRGETEFLYGEIFAGRGYLRHGIALRPGDRVFDVGANIGLFTLFAAREAPGVSVYAFEPIPEVFQALAANTALHGIEARLFDCALGETPGETELVYYPHATLLSGRHGGEDDREVVRSFLDRSGGLTGAAADELLDLRLESRRVTRPVRTLSQVIRDERVDGIDLLKIDAEKSELEVLSGLAPEDWGKVRQVVAEVHDLGGRLARVLDLLRGHGFTVAIEQDEALVGTALWNVYARRPDPAPERAVAVPPAPLWSRVEALVQDVRGHLASTLPEAMVPSAFALLDAFPLTPSGKLDRRALPKTAPGAPGAGREETGAAPRTPVEELLVGIWAEVLGVPRVGVDDSFFDLGGHSLLATQALSRLREAFGVEVPLRDLFAAPTVAGLAVAVEGARAAGEGAGTAPPLTRVSRERPPRLSFAQERLWFLDQLAPGNVAYNVPAAVRLTGRLDPAAFGEALGEIVRRHEVLRTTFATTPEGPVQVIASPLDFHLPLADLARLPRPARESEALRLAAESALRPFDLALGPLLRAALLKLGAEEHALLLTLHHIAADAWSMGVLLAELAALYPAKLAGLPSLLPELPVQYGDFAEWQRAWLQGEALGRQIAWWKERLAGYPTLLELPADRPRPALPSFRGGNLPRPLPEALTRDLRALARKRGATLFMTLLAAFSATLARFAGRPALLVGSTIANRTRRELEGLIGFFINTLAFPADLSDDPPFATALAQARETALAAYAHQDLPFERLVEELVPRRDPSRSPLVQVVLQMQNAPLPETGLPGLSWEPFAGGTETAKFDLVVNAMEGEWGMAGDWLYSADLFDAPTIGRLASAFETLLGAAVADPDRAVSDLPILGEGERQQLLREWNEGAIGAPEGDRPPHAVFAAQAAATPDALAVSFDGERLSYGELAARAFRVARHLRGLGIGPESRVGICLDRSPDLAVAILGILAAGGAYVPLDPAYPRERLTFLLTDSGVEALVTVEKLLPSLPETSALRVLLDVDRDLLASYDSTPLPEISRPGNLAYVIYTSGSTGVPKGVAVTHGNVARLFATTAAFRFGPGDVWTLFHSYAFDFSVWEIWGALLHGGRLVVVPHEVSRSPVDFVRLLAQEQVTVLNQTPSAFRQLIWAETAAEARLDSIRLAIFGGEALDVAALAPWFERHGEDHPTLVNLYGITETTVHTTWRRLGRADLTSPASPIGRPLPDLALHLLDSHLHPVPPGVPGELHVGGPGVARGYLGRPERTAERFLPDPLGDEPGARLYRSGDLARRRPDGQLDYLGRADDQVKIRGFRIEPGEVQAAVAAHPAVREAVVLARAGAAVGEETRLVAYAVPATADSPLTLADLRAFLSTRLPEHMLPSALALLPALPLTAHGKVDRGKLLAIEPETPAPSSPEESDEPRTPLERVLAGLFREVLKVPRVGRNDNFFELGGNSIAGAVLINRLQQELSEVVQVVVIFDAPTVAALADHLIREHRAAVLRLWGLESAGEREAPADEETASRVDAARLQELRRLLRPLPPLPPELAREPKNPPALFLLSPPRSGSTLLRVMLAGHPGLFAPPELELLSWNTLAERRAAFPGRDRFWLEGAVRAVMAARTSSAAEAEAFLAAAEREGWSTRRLYREIQDEIGGRLLVDKTPSYALDPAILAQAEESFSGALYLHLVRHPGAVVRSFEEAKLDQLFFRHPHSFHRRELAELIWLASQENVLAFLAGIPEERRHTVHFEELVRDPEPVLRGICRFLGLPYDPAMARPYEERAARMTDGVHPESRMLGDVKFHQHAGVDPSAADRGQGEADTLGEITWDLAERLGYRRPEPSAAGTAIPARAWAPGEPIPLSFAQERLWVLDRLEPGSAAYNVPTALRLTGRLDTAALRASLDEIARRHASLRTTFGTAGDPFQRIAPPAGLPLPEVDLAGLAPALRETEARRLANGESLRPFDLTRGPLVRAALLRLGAEENVALFTLHHIVSDGWSMGVLIRELAALYPACQLGEGSPLPPLPVQYADFAAWQRRRLRGRFLEEQAGHWRRTLTGAPPLDLPTDRPRARFSDTRGATQTVLFPAAVREAVARLAREGEATPFMVLLATWMALLSRWTGQEDFTVGFPVANRTQREVEGLIGFFVNTLLVRADLSGAPTFQALLERVRSAVLAAFAHQELPFEKVVDLLQPERDRSRNPLFDVLFSLQNAHSEVIRLPGLRLEGIPLADASAKLDLSLNFHERLEGDLAASVEYRTALFFSTTLLRHLGHLGSLLEAALADPGLAVAELPLLSAAERHQLLLGFDDAPDESLPADTFPALLVRQAAERPDALAAQGERLALTWTGLARRVRRLAGLLARLGVGPEVRVGLCVERSPAWLAALLAILEAGGVYVPLDPALPPERLALLAADAGVELLLTADATADRLALPRTLRLEELDAEIAPGGATAAAIAAPLRPASEDNLAYVIYTSGSTGRPKGVGVPHRGLARTEVAENRCFGLRAGDHLLQLAAIGFDVSLGEVGAALATGLTLHFAGREALRPGPPLAALLREREVTALMATPSVLGVLSPAALPALSRLVAGGEACPLPLAELWAEGRSFYNGYGPTETTISATLAAYVPGEPRITLGRPLPHVRLYLLDPAGQTVPVGTPGEVYLGGPGLARGYLGRPDLTAQAFVPDPFGPPGERLYRARDLARRLPDGRLEFLGRSDDQVKVRGVRIEPGEIEAALLAHPGVREAAVVLRSAGGLSGRRLVAWLAAAPRPTPDDLRRHLARTLPDAYLPAAFGFLDALPRTATDKLDRRALASFALPEEGAADRRRVPPRNGLERAVAAAWQEVLEVPAVGIEDRFFELGGNSLQAARLVNRLEASLGTSVPLADLFDAPTVAGLAARIATRERLERLELGEAAASPAPERILPSPWSPGDRLPLSFAQERLWFLDQLAPGTALYNIPSALRLRGPLAPAILEEILRKIVVRHAALRTTFGTAEGEVFQTVAPAPKPAETPASGCPRLAWLDLTRLPEGPREAEARRLADASARFPFDLSRGPLLRATLLRLGAADHLALFTMHHIVSDAWSMGLLTRELTVLYGRALAGVEGALPPLPVQYPDFALWQRERLAGAPLAAQTAYWVETLAGAPVLDLPTDLPRPAVPSERGGAAWRILSPALSADLAALAERAGATLFMVLLAGWSALLARYSGQDDVTVGTPIANRTHRELEDLIGFFVNTLALRLDLTGAPGFAELVRRARRTALAAFLHQDLPFEKVVEAVQPPRARGRSPLFQVMLSYQNTPDAGLDLPGLSLEAMGVETGSAKFDLTLSVQEAPGGLGLRAGYRADLWLGPTIERLLDHTVALLAAAVDAPDRPFSDLPLLSAAGRHQLLSEWNDTAPADLLDDLRLQDLFAAAARSRPDAPAVLTRGETLTYRELDRRSGLLACRLRRRGVGPESRVGVYLPRSPELLVAILGILRAGGAYLPLDLAHPKERIAFQLEDAGAALLLTQRDLLTGIAGMAWLPAGVPAFCFDEPGNPRKPRRPPVPVRPAADHLAYVIYTSGSTGAPNGVLVPHRGAVHLLRQAAALYGVTPESRVLQVAALGFDASVLEIFLALAHGASLYLPEPEERLDPALLANRLLEQGVTTAVLTPPLLAVLPAERLADLRSVSVGGEACPAELAARWATAGRRLLNCYGPTEATIFATVARLQPGERVTIGRPVPGVDAAVVDRALQPQPIGVPGELVLGGVGLARGYAGLSGKTALRFVPHPAATVPGARLYRTGDFARLLPAGEIEILGRIDDQVKVRGFRIEPGEIEAALLRHPAVERAAVVARGAGADRHLAAYAGAPGEPAPTPEELRSFLAASLPEHLVPAVIVVLPTLPATASGKVDRRALPAPDLAAPARSAPPETPMERFLAGLWREVLGRAEIGVGDDFFALGGTSLQAALLVNRLEERLGEYVYVVALFDAPTLGDLARYLERHYPAAAARVAGAEAGGAREEGAARVDDESLRRFRALIPRLPSRPRSSSGVPSLRRAVFLLSPPRSGSTLLRAMLAGHPALFAPPELELLGFETLSERAQALSGRWALWQEGTIRALMDAEGLSFEEAKRELEKAAARDLPVRDLYARLQKAIGGRTLVDKTPSYALDPGTLARAEATFEKPLYIHLLRHPGAMIASFTRARLSQVFFRHPHDLDPRTLAELIWLASQENLRAFLAQIPAERQIQLRFEDLVRDPRHEMERLAAFLKIDFHPALLDPYDDSSRRMTDGAHALSKMVGDVKFHEHRKVDPEAADAWRQEGLEATLGEPTSKVAESLGYERPRRPAFSPLVPLRTEGQGRPLFCVHPVGGNVLCYKDLARRLDRPVYGLQSLGLNGGEPQESVEAMATTYAAEVARAQPEGPLALAGWSIGGAIAWEMARQLTRDGREVSLLALIDSLAPGSLADDPEIPEDLNDAELLAAVAADLGGIAGRKVDLESGQARRLLGVYRANVTAVRRYRPAPLPGVDRIALLRAGERPGSRVPPPDLGWSALAPELEIRELAGDHYSLLRAPEVDGLAAALEELLSAARAES